MTERIEVERTPWTDVRPCIECNPLGLPPRNPDVVWSLPACPCNGTGWNGYAALATEPWSEIIPNLWIGAHDYIPKGEFGHRAVSIRPGNLFDVVVSAYHRDGFEPGDGVEYHTMLFPDAHLTPESRATAEQAAAIVSDALLARKKVLVRCQAGLNRSSFIAGLAMVRLGFEGRDVVQLIRSKRSPWALCNEEYAHFIEGLSAGSPSLTPDS